MKRLIKAFLYSLAGLKASFQTEMAFKQEVFLTIILVPIAVFTNTTIIEKILLIGSILIILMTELANTAIEAVVDRISMEKHPLSKKAKDVGSSIVLVALINMIMVWGLIFLL